MKPISKSFSLLVGWFDRKEKKKKITLERIKSPRVIQLFVRMVLTVYHYDTIESRVMAVQPLCNLSLMVHHEQPMNPMDVPQCEVSAELQKQNREKKLLLLLLLKAFKCALILHIKLNGFNFGYVLDASLFLFGFWAKIFSNKQDIKEKIRRKELVANSMNNILYFFSLLLQKKKSIVETSFTLSILCAYAPYLAPISSALSSLMVDGGMLILVRMLLNKFFKGSRNSIVVWCLMHFQYLFGNFQHIIYTILLFIIWTGESGQLVLFSFSFFISYLSLSLSF